MKTHASEGLGERVQQKKATSSAPKTEQSWQVRGVRVSLSEGVGRKVDCRVGFGSSTESAANKTDVPNEVGVHHQTLKPVET